MAERKEFDYECLKGLAKEIGKYGSLINEEQETLEISVIAQLLDQGKKLYDATKSAADAKSALESYSNVRAYGSALDKFRETEIAKKDKYKPIIDRIEKRYEITKQLNMFYLTLNKEEIQKMQEEFANLIEEIDRWVK